MADVTITIEGLDKLEKMFGELQAGRYMGPILRQGAEELKKDIARYPGPPSYPLVWTKAERISYMQMRREKGLPIKYTRSSDRMSQRLGASWTTDVAADGMSASVGTDVTYARQVQDAEYQTPMHKATGWTTVQDVAEKRADDIVELVAAEIGRILAG